MAKFNVKKYMKEVREYLTQKYGDIPLAFESSLFMLQENLEDYILYKEQIAKTYIIDQDGKKNPLISSVKDLEACIMKIWQHLGLTVYSQSKIKNTEEDTTEDFIDGLIS